MPCLPARSDSYAIVTGAASGLGRALAVRLSERGYRLELCDRNGAELEQTQKLLPPGCNATIVDVADRDAVANYAAGLLEHCGAPRLLVNNAGVLSQHSVRESSLEDFDWVMSINFWGMVYFSKAFLEPMLASGVGCIANVSSYMGYTALPNSAAYASSKHAIAAFTRALCAELRGSGVFATCIHPGTIATGIARNSRFRSGFDGNTDRSRFERQLERSAMLTSPVAAAKIVRGIELGKTRIVVGADARMLDWLTRLLPANYDRLIVPLVRWSLAR